MSACAIEIALTIPDNEAYTALTTLRRLGVEASDLRRADLWRFELEKNANETLLVDRVRTLEAVYNPNKHALRVRERDVREPGEVWIEEPGRGVIERPVRISGRALPGVARAARYTSWRLFKEGRPASQEFLQRAVVTLLCHPAFQKAII